MHPLRFYLKARWNSESECLNKVWQRFNDREKTMKFLDQAKIYVNPATAVQAAFLSAARSILSSAARTAVTAAKAAAFILKRLRI